MTTTQEQAKAYARIRYRLFFMNLAVTVLFLFFFQLSGLSAALADWARRVTSFEPAALALYLLVFGALTYLVDFPLHLYRSWFLEHRFGLSRLNARGWCVRELKHLAVNGILGLILVESLYALFRSAPRTWPIWAAAGWIFLSVVLARVFPTMLLPIFYKTKPVENPALVERLVALCNRVGVDALGVFRFDLGAETRKANAMLAGLGRSRRVILSDTLMEHFPEEEIEGVLAHELAHHHFRHIPKGLALAAVGSLVGFFLTAWAAPLWLAPLGLNGLADIAGFPALSLWLSVMGLVGMPVQNAISRAFEWQADRFAVWMSASPKVFAQALRRLGELNLADPNPPAWIEWFFFDHPSIGRRVQAAEQAAWVRTEP